MDLMDFELSKSRFLEIFEQISSDSDRSKFFHWLRDEVLPEFEKTIVPKRFTEMLEGSREIEMIAADIRTQLPQEGVMQSEQIMFPTVGEDTSLTPANTVHVDAFLYDEAAEDALVEEGVLARSYCLDCGSRRIEDLTFITHSCSKARLEYMFTGLLPSLQGKTIIDIGSRIGAVLYGAYYYSAASRIVGVEINSDLCRIQQGIVEKYKLGDRVSVVEGDMCTLGDLIRTGDVVVLNNVFDWFMPPEVQVTMWTFLRSTLAPGSLLVTIPSLPASLGHLDTGISLASWVRPLQRCGDPGAWPGEDTAGDQVELSEVCLYQVLPPPS